MKKKFGDGQFDFGKIKCKNIMDLKWCCSYFGNGFRLRFQYAYTRKS